MGELMSGQFERSGNNTIYWTLTSNNIQEVYVIYSHGRTSEWPFTLSEGVKPAINLKSNVQIISGTGTKSDPFVITLGS